jgi:acyl carrier protein
VATLKQNELTDLIIQWVRNNRQPGDFSNPEITESTDLMAAGLLDSFGFVDLLLFLEAQTGTRVDLTDVDPSEFTVVKSLCNIVVASRNGDSLPLQQVSELETSSHSSLS